MVSEENISPSADLLIQECKLLAEADHQSDTDLLITTIQLMQRTLKIETLDTLSFKERGIKITEALKYVESFLNANWFNAFGKSSLVGAREAAMLTFFINHCKEKIVNEPATDLREHNTESYLSALDDFEELLEELEFVSSKKINTSLSKTADEPDFEINREYEFEEITKEYVKFMIEKIKTNSIEKSTTSQLESDANSIPKPSMPELNVNFMSFFNTVYSKLSFEKSDSEISALIRVEFIKQTSTIATPYYEFLQKGSSIPFDKYEFSNDPIKNLKIFILDHTSMEDKSLVEAFKDNEARYHELQQKLYTADELITGLLEEIEKFESFTVGLSEIDYNASVLDSKITDLAKKIANAELQINLLSKPAVNSKDHILNAMNVSYQIEWQKKLGRILGGLNGLKKCQAILEIAIEELALTLNLAKKQKSATESSPPQIIYPTGNRTKLKTEEGSLESEFTQPKRKQKITITNTSSETQSQNNAEKQQTDQAASNSSTNIGNLPTFWDQNPDQTRKSRIKKIKVINDSETQSSNPPAKDDTVTTTKSL